MAAISEEARAKLPYGDTQALSNTAWAFATLLVEHRPLMDAISAEALARIFGDTASEGFAQFLLALAWSAAFLLRLSNSAFAHLQSALRRLGSELDARAAGHGEGARGSGDVDWIYTRSGVKPSLPLDLRGMVTVYKPTDWEVDGLVVEEGSHPPLSAYMQSVFPKACFPLVWDAEHNYGFLHRLDIPSSGLVLGGTSFEGYFSLRLQLDTHLLRREYVVACQGLADATLSEVVARVDVAPDPSQRKSVTDSGKPSQTLLRIIGQLHSASLVAVRIATGRRHQIRVHLRHRGLPSLADARYTCREVCVTARGVSSCEAGATDHQGLLGTGRRWTYNAVAE